MIALRTDVRCKHCGRFLDAEDTMLAERIGLDADECVDQIRCLAESGESYLILADLSWLRDWLMEREAGRLQAGIDSLTDDQLADRAIEDVSRLSDRWVWRDHEFMKGAALTGADLFSREVRTSSALW